MFSEKGNRMPIPLKFNIKFHHKVSASAVLYLPFHSFRNSLIWLRIVCRFMTIMLANIRDRRMGRGIFLMHFSDALGFRTVCI